MKQLFMIAGAVALAAVWLSAVAAPKGPEYAVVTCADDGTGFGGGKITLRDAVEAMADPAFTNAAGARVITFASGLTVKLTASLVIGEGTLPFTIDGGANDARVAIASADGSSCRLFEHRGHGLTLRNLTLAGGNADGAGGAVYATGPASVTNQALTVSNCAFTANVAKDGGAIAAESNTVAFVQGCSFGENIAENGAGAVRTAGRLTAVSCTFYSNLAQTGGAGAVAVAKGGVLFAAQCTVAANVGAGGGVGVVVGAAATLCDCLLIANCASMAYDQLLDLVNDGTITLIGTGLTSRPGGKAPPVLTPGNDFNLDLDAVVSGEPELRPVVNGVINTAVAVIYCQSVTNGAGVLWHDAAWTNVAVAVAGGAKTALCGSAALATIRLDDDQTGRAERPARGSMRHDFKNRIRFMSEGQVVKVVEARCGSTELPTAPPAGGSGLALAGWYSEPGGKGVRLWKATGEPDAANLPKVPYEPIVAYAHLEMSDAAFTVSDGGDGEPEEGKATLRMLVAAMAAHPEWAGSAGRRVITIPASVGTVVLTRELEVTNGIVPFVIRGAWDGTNAVTIRAVQDSDFRLFRVENAGMGFENLTFEGAQSRERGRETGGGAIWAGGECALTVSNCAFRANSAYMAGGAVRLLRSGTFERCSFHANLTLGDNGHGGAVSVDEDGMASFSNCSFTLNSPTGLNSPGGAVYGLNGARCTFEGCTFFGNTATEAGAVAVGMGVPTFTGCLAVSNSPSALVSTTLTNLLGEVLADSGRTFDLAVGGAKHAYVRPKRCAAITDAPGATGGIDLLGAAAPAPALGAVRGEYGIRFDLNPGEQGVVEGDVSWVWGVCGRPIVGVRAPKASRSKATFVGWWTGPGRSGERCFDESGNPDGAFVAPFAGEMTLYAGWQMSLDDLTVTTAEDVLDQPALGVSLRDVIGRIVENGSGGDGREIRVTFALPDNAVISLAKPLEIPANVAPFVIDGSNGATAVTLGAATGDIDALFATGGRGLTLRNLMFKGSCRVATLVSTNGALTVENCAFDVVGIPVYATGAGLVLLSDSFIGVMAPLVCHAQRNTVVNCTVLGQTDAAVFDCANDTCLLKCTLPGTGWTGSPAVVDVITDPTLLAETNVVTRCNGVEQVWRPALKFPSLTQDPSWIWHDGDWSNIAGEKPGDRWTEIRGSRSRATQQLSTDQLGKPDDANAKCAVRSRFAVRFELDAKGGTVSPTNAYGFCGEAPGPLPIPQRDRRTFAGWLDSEGELRFGPDGKPQGGFLAPWAGSMALTARWAVPPEVLRVGDAAEFQEALDALADAGNDFQDRTITIVKPTIQLSATLKVKDGTEPFTIEGGGATIDGGGQVQLLDHRGKGLVLRNLTLTGGNGAEGGAVGARQGSLRAENCAFVNNKARVGGALYTEASLNLLLDCTFVGNEADVSGNAITLYTPFSFSGPHTTVMIHCTVVEKTSDTDSSTSSIYADFGNKGSFSALACSFVGSGNTKHNGGALGVGSTARVTLAGCAFARHPDSYGTEVRWNDPSAVNAERCTFSKTDLQGHWRDCCKTSVANTFADWTNPKARTNKGVTHTCYPPAIKTEMADGVWVWHDSTWENIAYSTSPIWNQGEMRVVVGDPAACIMLKSTDQTGLAFFPQALFRGASTVIASKAFGLEVTTAEDKLDPSDEHVSLREAIIAAASGQLDPGRDGNYTITFADSLFAESNAVTVNLDCTGDMGGVTPTANIVIQGRTDGRSVALAVRNNQPAPAFKVEPNVRFALRNLTVNYTCVKPGNTNDNGFVRSEGELEITDCLFEKCRQWRSSPMIVGMGGTAGIERCSFVGDPSANEAEIVGGGSVNTAGANMRVIDCTFADLNLKDKNNLATWGVVEAQSTGGAKSVLAVVNCTFTGNRMDLGSVCACWAGTEVSVLNCIFNDNRSKEGDERDVYVDNAWFRARGCVYSAMVRPIGGGGTQALVSPEVEDCEVVKQASAIFEGSLKRILKDGVWRAYRPPKLYGPADRHGRYVWHDAAWTNVAITAKYVNQTDKTIVVGTEKGLARTLAGRYDVVGRDALEGLNVQLGTAKDRQATMGSYTMPLDGEAGEPGELVVTTVEDDGTTEHDYYDGKLSLREAVDFANTHPHWRDTNGNCRVTFADSIFAKNQRQTIASRMRQMEVTAFTNGTLSVVGPASAGGESGDTRSVTLNGQGRYRLFYVAPGNALALANLGFTNAVSQKVGLCQTYAGGAINSRGRIAVRNCAFRDCRTFQNANLPMGASLGRAYGGAVCTEEGGSSVLERCAFFGCQATAGGAVCTAEGGDTVLAGSTFADNLVIRYGTVETGRGGAVCALDGALRTVLVNCTLTRNLAQDSGGAIAAGLTKDDSGKLTTALYLLDSIVLGNGASEDEATGDIRLDGKAKLAHCWLGRRNEGELDGQWADDTVLTGKVPADIFGRCTQDGVAIDSGKLSSGVWQPFFSLNDGVETGAAFVWTYGGWANVGYATDKNGMRQQSVLYVRERNDEIRLKSRGEPMTVQQLGDQSWVRALMGAAEQYEPQERPVPVVDVDPLCVTNDSFRTFCEVLDYAATHTGDPSLVSNGCLTITFAGNFTINVASNLTLSGFASPKLRIVGPVTFSGKPYAGAEHAFRPFLVTDGSALVLENVTFVDCVAADGFGGAICLEGAELEASNVTFSGCKAYSEDDEMGFGGAVAALYGSVAVFEGCTFNGNEAPDGDGQDVYRYESAATFADCLFKAPVDERLQNEVVDWLNALVLSPVSAVETYYDTVAEALAHCLEGDTLVLLNPNGPDEDLVRKKLPPGVTLRIFGDEEDAVALSLVQARAGNANAGFEKDEPWYSATVRKADGLVMLEVGLNELAKPVIDGEGQVDFDAGDGTEVSVWPANVKPKLWYGLGRSEAPEGPFAVEEDGWVQADANGTLPRALTAPKVGGAGYYRVIVR